MAVGKIKEFDISTGNWLLYCERMEMYFKANKISEDLKLATLISNVGDDTYELIVNLVSPAMPAEKTYEEIKAIVGEHLQPRPSIMAERYRFRQRRQNTGESVAQYIAELKRLSRYCDFKSVLSDNLRDQMVCGVTSDIIRQRLFAEETLTYEKAVRIATSLEAAEINAASVERGGSGTSTRDLDSVHAMAATAGTRTRGSSAGAVKHSECAVCGARDHLATVCKYSAYACDNCGVIGHLQRMCMRQMAWDQGEQDGGQRGSMARGRGRSARGRGARGRRHRRGRGAGQPTYLVQEDQSDELSQNLEELEPSVEDDDEPIYQMSLRDYPAVSLHIIINNKKLSMELDTGSAYSCINSETFKALFSEVPLRECKLNLKFYDGSKIKPLGVAEVMVTYKGLTKKLDLYVISGGTTSLLGRQWLAELNIPLPTFQSCHNVNEQQCVKTKTDKSSEVGVLLDSYGDLFDGTLGRYKGGQATLHVRADATPIHCRARPLPYSLRERVDLELDAMLRSGTIEQVEVSSWATPLVVVHKPNGKLRVCADYKVTLNSALLVDKYPLPRVEDLFAGLTGGEQFTKIDMSSAYNQIALDQSSEYTVVNTHRGLFKYNRLPYGLSSSPGIFCRIMTNLMRDLPGVGIFMDDIIITGKTRELHVRTLEEVFKRLRVNGFKLNRDKCVILADSVSYLGYIVDKNGIHTDPGKVRAIMKLPVPTNVSELRSFIGMINFYGRFIKDLSTLLAPLYSLLKNNSRWNWDEKCDMAFKNIKKQLCGAEVLAHYDIGKPLILTCDASAKGISAILSQPSESGERPVAYASRALTAAEQHYSQIQREALSIVFGVKKYHQYLYGRVFTLRTDHKPLVSIFGPKAGIPPMASSRLQRWAIILSAYNFNIEYVRSQDNSADALSRLPLKVCEGQVEAPEQTYLHFARDALLLDYEELRKETKRDPVLGRVLSYVMDGWPSENDVIQLQPYFNRRKEIYLELGCLLWGHRVIIPAKYHEKVLRELHETHLGIVKMKSLARSYVWWPGLDEAVEATCRACGTCAALATAPPAHVPHPWPVLQKPWSRLHLDFLGPIAGHKYLVIVDATSKWIEIFKMSNTNATAVINILRRLFAQFGLPKQVVSDNGPPFTSEHFKQFLNKNGIEQSLTAPYHPSSNGAAENAVKLCKAVIKKAVHDGVDSETALCRFLLLYRNTEHSSTGDTPARVLQGRSLRNRLDMLKPDRSTKMTRVQQAQLQNRSGSDRSLGVGEDVFMRTYREGRPAEWTAGTIVRKLGDTNYRVRVSNGTESHRHVDQLRRKSRSSLIGTSPQEPTYEPLPCSSGHAAVSPLRSGQSQIRSNNERNSNEQDSLLSEQTSQFTANSVGTLPYQSSTPRRLSSQQVTTNDQVVSPPKPVVDEPPLRRVRNPPKRYGFDFD